VCDLGLHRLRTTGAGQSKPSISSSSEPAVGNTVDNARVGDEILRAADGSMASRARSSVVTVWETSRATLRLTDRMSSRNEHPFGGPAEDGIDGPLVTHGQDRGPVARCACLSMTAGVEAMSPTASAHFTHLADGVSSADATVPRSDVVASRVRRTWTLRRLGCFLHQEFGERRQ
jgi:hypothetical protein